MSEPREHWEHFGHGADVGIRGFGTSPSGAFAQAALAMTAAVTNVDEVDPCESIEIVCEAPTLDDLLFDFLDALVFEMSTRRMLFGEFVVHIEEGRLSADVRGECVDRVRHQPAVEVKGPTYTALEVDCDDAGEWHAQCVIDV